MEQKSKNKKITIVIVTHNAQNYLPDLLESLEKQYYPKNLVEIIVVDNGSEDDTRMILQIFMKNRRIKIIENKENLGFAKGNNTGIKEALKRETDYIILLNQDMVVEPSWLEELVEVAGIDSKIGAVQPMILLWEDKNRTQTAGNKIHFLGFGYSGDYKKSRGPKVESRESDVAYASGAASLIKREVLEKIGFLDEDLWAYHEDLDFGWRLRLVGYEIKKATKSIVYHKYSFTKTKEKYYFMERNRLIVLWKNYKLATLILIFPIFIFMECGLWFFALIKGWGEEKLRSYRDFLKSLPKTLVKRKKIQKQRLVKDKEIIKHFVGKVEFEDLQHPFLNYIANPIFDLYWRVIKYLIFW